MRIKLLERVNARRVSKSSKRLNVDEITGMHSYRYQLAILTIAIKLKIILGAIIVK